MARKRRKKESWEPVSYSHPVFRPYTAALGQIALAWNGLHSQLALLFCTMMGGGYSNNFLGIWHALKNDGAQRDILLAAARESRSHREHKTEEGRRVYEEIKWLHGQARAISDARDDALHTPLWGEDGARRRVLPVTGLGHVRAQKLMDASVTRGLLAEFRWCRDAALVLTDYAFEMDNWLTGRSRKPWPDRPSLPNRGRTKSDPRSRPTHKAKHAPRPRS